MRFLKIKFAILSLIVLVACQENQNNRGIESINKAQIALDSAAQTYRTIDTTGYSGMNKKYKQNVAFVQQKLVAKGDTIDRETAMFMTKYRELKKPYAQFKTQYEQAGKELEFSENQLITLKHDLKNNKMDSLMAKRNLSKELDATESIISTIKNLNVANERIRDKTAKMEPRIDSLMNVLKQY